MNIARSDVRDAGRYFEPWIGSAFGRNNNALGGLRLMIVGESHYCPNEPHAVGTCTPGRTRDCVKEGAIDGSWSYFTRILYLISGRRKSEITANLNEEFWNSVAFYNFVPVFVAESARKRPRRWMWSASYDPFNLITREIAPEAMLVTGWDLWWYVMDASPGGVKANNPAKDFNRIGGALSARIRHPSAPRFSIEKERCISKQLMEDASNGGMAI